MDSCFDLVADFVSLQDWNAFSEKLKFGFKGFPSHWPLPDDIREKLILKMQWFFFNPDLVAGVADKRARSWAFMSSFLCENFGRKFSFLRTRQDKNVLENWDRQFADFEGLLYLSSMDEAMQLDWLSNFDARMRYGNARRVKVIKNKGLGLCSPLLGVEVLMDWNEIKARYRFMLKKHHPDLGGDPALARDMIQEFNRLAEKAGKKV